jgi:hypothetical protein
VIFFIFAIDEFGHAVTLKVKAALKNIIALLIRGGDKMAKKKKAAKKATKKKATKKAARKKK